MVGCLPHPGAHTDHSRAVASPWQASLLPVACPEENVCSLQVDWPLLSARLSAASRVCSTRWGALPFFLGKLCFSFKASPPSGLHTQRAQPGFGFLGDLYPVTEVGWLLASVLISIRSFYLFFFFNGCLHVTV